MGKSSQQYEKMTFSGHQTFALRLQWPRKVYEYIKSNETVLSNIESMKALGLGSNMVISALYWSRAIGIIDNKHEITPFGKLLFGNGRTKGLDPYGESFSTLYLYHWNIVTNKEQCSSVWFLFNKFKQVVFTREDLLNALISYVDELHTEKRIPKAISSNTLKKDLEGILRTYCPRTKDFGKYGTKVKDMRNAEEVADSALAVLCMIGFLDEAQHTLTLQREARPTLSNEVFAYCLISYWQTISKQLITLDYTSIRDREGSPGLLFRLDDESLINYLEALSDTTCGLFEWNIQNGIYNVVYKSQEHDEKVQNSQLEKLKNDLITKAIKNELE